ncbi:MAG TPA: hypothetical protein EYG89_01280 [Bacteroidia bacterium]|nr:hypothetical protein [Bacteroidia bacterium]
MYHKTNIKDIRELVCENGFKDNKKSDPSISVNEEKITEARDWIRLKLTSTKKINRRAERSYALKKKIEKYLKKLYENKEISNVSNGDVIVAM